MRISDWSSDVCSSDLGGRVEARGAHVDGDLFVVAFVQHQDAGGDFGAQRIAAGQALFVHEADEAARAVAAVLDFGAVGVEDAVAEVGVGMGDRKSTRLNSSH